MLAGVGLFVPQLDEMLSQDGNEPSPVASNDREARSTWTAVDLSPHLSGDDAGERPTLLRRTDGQYLLYGGRVHLFYGPPESSKGWLTLLAGTQCLEAGGVVVYVDLEDSPRSAVERLLALGADPSVITDRFVYVRPDEPLSSPAAMEDLQDILRLAPALFVVDGVTEVMTLHDLDPNSNPDTSRFMALLPKKAAAAGAAVVLIDHVTKDAERRGRYPVGAGHKLAMLDGTGLSLDVVRLFGRGLEGMARITLHKDRLGFVRAAAAGGTVAGELHMSPGEEGRLDLRVKPAKAGPFRPTVLMERISRRLEHGDALSQNRILDEVLGKRTALIQALACLVAEGYVAVEHKGQAAIHSSVKPFREEEEQ
jgi:hypothetical protein